MSSGLAELHDRARAVLDPVHYDYYAGGVGEEVVLGENEAAFRRLALLPRVLRGSTARDLAVDLPGARLAVPVLVAPTAFHRLAHPEGERATARAAAAAGTVLVSGMASTVAVDEVVAAARGVDPDAAVWFQLYPQPDEEVTACLVRRAERAGCAALVVTADSPVFGRHRRDAEHGFHDLPPGLAAENMRDLPGGPPGGTRDIEMSPSISWEHLDRLRASTALPVWLKGVLHPADAVLAVGHGVDGIVVSNHGGRQCDLVPAAVEALPAVVDAVAGRVPVLLDGGVRGGGDVAVALALGAAAVGVGRPVLWGLAAAGEAGVARVLELLRDEFDHVLALCGGRGVGDLTRDLVVVRGTGVGGIGTAGAGRAGAGGGSAADGATRPSAAGAGAAGAGAAGADAAGAGAARAGTTGPDAAGPDAAGPDATRAGTTGPDAAGPSAAGPDAAGAGAAGADATRANAAGPGTAEAGGAGVSRAGVGVRCG
ncbi:alpha-hydroxy acid oxidase [Saccharothrix syringae]|uniref:Alpha-hydroxy-acid oxidizing protein n=1 Tax=Saccharothrix syringae TaxID=103733 RepID=A0A5Q0H546_SACSY|nr:alpha-hydroxy acid oxidase [Saccharothrix syringae]QFZ21064.1 alpha-hydroxy-acid oxidizing protein [Saccharothrix syringae]